MVACSHPGDRAGSRGQMGATEGCATGEKTCSRRRRDQSQHCGAQRPVLTQEVVVLWTRVEIPSAVLRPRRVLSQGSGWSGWSAGYVGSPLGLGVFAGSAAGDVVPVGRM